MKKEAAHPQDTKAVFLQCGTCSQTFGHLLNRAFGYPKGEEERALDPLAGGILNQGYQCGMLWGAVLAIGAEAYRQQQDLEEAVAVATTAAQHLIESFEDRTHTVNCREITGLKLNTVAGMAAMMIRTMRKGMRNSPCFNLAEDWAPEAIAAGKEGLADPLQLTEEPVSCAAEVARRMGGSEAERAMVAGFAGGLGLSGNACGALAAAIWMKNLAWCREHPEQNPPLFFNSAGKQLLRVFRNETGGKMRCREITGRQFADINEHSVFIRHGGCATLIEELTQN